MSFNAPVHAANRTFAQTLLEAIEQVTDGPRKDRARAHLRAARIAELCRNEADWLLNLERAARALAETEAEAGADRDPPERALAEAQAYFNGERSWSR